VNASEYEDLLKTAVRRDLTASEQARLEAWLSTSDAAREEGLLDQRLNRCLRQLPDVPLSPNFTARILRQVERLAERQPAGGWLPVWVRWLRGGGYGWQLAGAVGVLALVVGIQYHQAQQRAELARSLAALPAISLAEVDLWRDFESINTLPAGPLPSVDLLAEAFK